MASITARDISKFMRVCYLRVVGDWHSDAVLIRDVVGAVIWRAWARAGCAATCRVWNARRHTNQTHKKPAAVWNKTLRACRLLASYLPCRASVSWRWWWDCLGDAAADCSYARLPSASAGSAASGLAQTLKKIEKRPNSFFEIQFEHCYSKCINTLMKKALLSYWNEKKT